MMTLEASWCGLCARARAVRNQLQDQIWGGVIGDKRRTSGRSPDRTRTLWFVRVVKVERETGVRRRGSAAGALSWRGGASCKQVKSVCHDTTSC